MVVMEGQATGKRKSGNSSVAKRATQAAERGPRQRDVPPSKIDRGTIEGHGWDKALREKVETCPREAEHRYGPYGYVAWHAWADERRKTHRQFKCECGLYLLMAPKVVNNA